MCQGRASVFSRCHKEGQRRMLIQSMNKERPRERKVHCSVKRSLARPRVIGVLGAFHGGKIKLPAILQVYMKH